MKFFFDDQRFGLTLGRDLILAIHLGVQPFISKSRKLRISSKKLDFGANFVEKQ